MGMMDDAQETANHYSRVIDRKTKHSVESGIYVESGDISKLGSEGAITNEVRTQNFMDVTGSDIKPVSAGFSVSSDQGQKNILDLEEFFERPVEIYSTQISTGVLSANLAVWDLWSLIPSVRAKLKNYAYFRGNMKIRVVLSGTPFDYGRLLVSYQPFPGANATLINYASMMGISTNIRQNLLNYLSQADGAFVMNPNENKPVDIHIPFMSPKPMHRLFNVASTSIGSGTSFADFADAGALYLYTLNTFASMAPVATSTVVTLQVYAWMEDVELGAPTATQLAITTESGEWDEKEQGPVEKVATNVLDVSKALMTIPGIAPFATASSIAASAVKNIAALFGWSKPIMTNPYLQMKNQPFSNGAQTIGNETAKKISLDPKQELTVDPRVLGTDKDDMIISRISSRKSYIATYTWGQSTPVFSLIGSMRVTPNLGTNYFRTPTNYFQPSAMMFAAAPFAYWRGDIVFVVEIVCSAFHRGKLMIGWEPNNSQYSVITSNLSLNKQFIRVIDIQQTQTVEFRVNWGSYRPWLKVGQPQYANYNITDPSQVNERTGFANGFIYICPFTQLQAQASEVVSINVYAYCDNLQVNGMTSLNLPSGRAVYTSSGEYGVQSTVDISEIDLNESTATTKTICKECFGEQPLSFRSLLKRFNTRLHYAISNAGQIRMTVTQSVVPPNTMVYTTVSPTYTDLFSYLRYAFVGLRGSVRYRYNCNVPLNTSTLAQAKFTLYQPLTSTTTGIAYNTLPARATMEGTVMYVPFTNGGLEVELPLYTNNLFLFSCYDNNLTYDAAQDFMDNLFFQYFRLDIDSVGTISSGYLEEQIAFGEDFSLIRFQGAPFFSY